MNTKATGDTTEAAALYEFVSNDYRVAVPFGDNDPYDLIVDDAGTLYRVQCKTAWQNKPETIRFNTHSQTTKEGAYHETTYEDEIDAFFVRYPDDDSFYWVPIAEATTQKMELRFDAELDHPSINWASRFEFSGVIR